MLLSIAYLLLLALALGAICTRLKLPPLVGMLCAGIVLGPYGLDQLSDQLLSISVELRQIALIIILMRAGLALDLSSLKRVGRPALLLCFVPACFEIAAITLIAPMLLGISTLEAALMGTVVAAVSPAVVVPKMLRLMEEKRGVKNSIPQMIMAGGSVDDIFVIVIFTSLMTLCTGGEFTPMALLDIPESIVLGLVAGIALGVAMVWFFRTVHMRDTAKILILMSAAFMLMALEQWAKEWVSMSALLAVMAMGATVLSRHEVLARRLSVKYSKMWVLAEILLFVLVGATVDVSYAIEAGGSVVLVLLFALVWRMGGVYLSMVGTKLSQRERVFCMIAYTPKATVQAAIGSLPLAAGIASGEIILSIAVVSILLTAPLGAFGIDLTSGRLLAKE